MAGGTWRGHRLLLILKATSLWAFFIPVAILNGFLRGECLVPLLGQRLALSFSGISGAMLFFLYSYLALPCLGPVTPRHCRLIGLSWLAMTVLFEFLSGRLVAGKSWEALSQASISPL